MNIKPLTVLLALPAFLLVGCAGEEQEPWQPPRKEEPKEEPKQTKMDQVMDLVEKEAPSWEGKDEALQTYIVEFCQTQDTQNLLDVPPTPAGVTEEDAGYVGGLLIASEACPE